MNNKLNLIVVFILGIFAFLSFAPLAQEAWVVPEKYDKLKNPVAYDDESTDIGKSLYNKHCKSCHGKEGLGDGSKADQLDTSCGDFTDESFMAQSDGSLYYKTLKGRDDMPSFEKKIPDSEDIWHLVNYMRLLGE